MKKFFKSFAEKFPKDWPTRIILVVILVFALVGAVYGYGIARMIVSTNDIFSLPGDPVVKETQEFDPEATAQPTKAPVASLPTPEPWDGVSRVNVLLMGLDYRDWASGDIPHSDTMILLTLDPVNKTAGILSIPRDLWVNVPGYGYYKINTAFYLGELNNLPGGGAGLAVKTVEEFLGVPVDYYAQIDFQAFIDFIDHIQGVKLTFDEPIVLDRFGEANTVTIPPGTITLPGDYALAYVRLRKTEGGDFDRAARQQNLIMAVRDRILEFDMLPTLIANAPEIYNDLSAGINTNIALNQMIQLAWSAIDVDRNNITQLVISNEYITLGKSPDGLDILIPIPDKIRLLRDEVFNTGASLGPVAEGDLLSLVAEEGARVSIRNGSYQGGLAASTAAWLREQGVNVVEEADATYTIYTQIYINGATPYAVRYLTETMNISSTSTFFNYTANAEFDVIVVLGDDWAGNNPLP